MNSLRDAVVVITGAARGLGLAVAQTLADLGARPVMVDVDPRVDEEASALSAPAHRVDVADPQAVARLFALVRDTHGRLHGLVNNAGVGGPPGLADQAGMARVLDVNVMGVLNCMQQGAAVMGPGGAVVNLGSINGVEGITGAPMYSASKAVVLALTRHAAVELGPKGIRVNALLPGNVLTDMLQRSYPSANLRLALSRLIPLRRLGRPAEVAAAVAFLLSDQSAYLTGQSLVVDGGSLCAWESR